MLGSGSVWRGEPAVTEETTVGKILVHEFTTVDGVIDAPAWAGDGFL